MWEVFADTRRLSETSSFQHDFIISDIVHASNNQTKTHAYAIGSKSVSQRFAHRVKLKQFSKTLVLHV